MPVNEALQGKDLSDLVDKNGMHIITELDKAAKNGGGFASYVYEKPGKGLLAAAIKLGTVVERLSSASEEISGQADSIGRATDMQK